MNQTTEKQNLALLLKKNVRFFSILSFLFLLCVSVNAQQEIDPYKARFRVKPGFENNIPLIPEGRQVGKTPIPALWAGLVQEYGIKTLQKASRLPSPRLQRYFEITLTDSANREALFQRLQQIPFIEHVEYYEWHQTSTLPNDMRATQWYLSKVRAVEAWQITLGNPKILLAIVDDAVYLDHEDLKESIYTNPNEIPNNGIDDDQNGYIDDVNGWDMADNDNDPNPPANANANFFSHGTHCAGIAAARTNNGVGIASLGGNVTILPVKASISGGNGRTIQAGYQGIEYAALMGAKVISCSWGGSRYSQFLQDLVSYVAGQGITILAAAGNSAINTPHYPAAYADVIAVAATNSQDRLASFSNFGVWVDIAAPGERILSTVAGNPSNYTYYDGTSMATPLAAGLCAQMYSVNPNLTPRRLLECLKASAVSIDYLHPDKIGQLGAGRIDAAAALACVLPKQSEAALYPVAAPWACNATDSLRFEVQNQGTTTYNELTFEYQIDGIPDKNTFTWQGVLAGGQSLQLSLPTSNAPAGASSVILSLNPPPPGDSNLDNNRLTFALNKPTIGVPVSCGNFITGATQSGVALRNAYPCAPMSLKGPETWHPFTLEAPALVDIRFRYGEEGDGRLILVSACNPDNCIITMNKDGSVYLDSPGQYYFIVDSDSLPTRYELGFNCLPWNCGLEQEVISCGDVLTGSLGEGVNLLEYYGNCRFEPLPAMEKIFVLELSDTTRLQARLSNVTEGTYLMLLNACDAPVCVAAGFANRNSNTPINGRIAPGKYYLAVDAVAPTNFTLTLECFDCAGAQPLSCGNTVSGTNVGRANRVNNYCLPALTLNGPEAIHPLTVEGPGFVTVTLNTTQPNLDLVVLSDCNYGRCLGYGDKEVTFYAPAAGVYQVIVDSRNRAIGAYTLSASCDEYNCRTGQKLTCGAEISGRVLATGSSPLARYNCATGRDLLGNEVIHPIEITEPGQRLVQLNLSSSDQGLSMLVLNECDPNRCAALVNSDYSAWVTGPRTLYVALERNRVASSDYTLKFNCFSFNCTEQSALLSCNTPFRGNTADGQNRFTSYNCRAGSFTGPENIHRIQLTEASGLFIRIRSLTQGRRVFAFLVGGCNPQNCFLSFTDSVNVQAGAGTYFLVVEGEGTNGVGYEVEYMCGAPNCENPEPIACGSAVTGSTAGQRSQLGYYSCRYAAQLAGGEKVYTLTPSQSGLYRFELTSQNPGNNPHVLILQTACSGLSCQALWEAAPRLDEAQWLEEGIVYYLVVDSRLPGGSFELKISCPCSPLAIEGLEPAYCPAQPVNIRANTVTGIPLWYDSPVGDNLLRRGPFFTLPRLTQNQVVYVENAVSCIPRRQAVWLNLTQPIIRLTGNKSLVCFQDTLILQASGGARYKWEGYQGADIFSQEEKALITPRRAGVITVIGTDENGCANTSAWPVRIQEGPPVTVLLRNDTLFAQNFTRYQWYYEDEPISGANQSWYTPRQIGNYSVYVENEDNDCGTLSAPVLVQTVSRELAASASGFSVYPNPTSGVFYLEIPYLKEKPLGFRLYNALGQNLEFPAVPENEGGNRYRIEAGYLPAGVYMLAMFTQSGVPVPLGKIIKR